MLKKLLSLLLAAVLAVSLCSCELVERVREDIRTLRRMADPIETTYPYLEIEPKEVAYNEGYTPVQSHYSYDVLPLEGERALYTELVKSYYDISPEKDEEVGLYPMPEIRLKGYSLSEAEVRTTMKAVSDDYPEIFWPGGTLGFYSDNETTVVQPYTLYSAQEVDRMIGAVRTAAEEFYATVPDGLSAYERELLVHDYLIENVAYEENVDLKDASANDPEIYTVYGALVEKKAVCEGYTRAFQMLLNGLGVDCVGILGSGENELHIWNAVKLDDTWVQVDATWDDQEEIYARYLYFNVTEDYMLRDHTYSKMFTELSEAEINGYEGDCPADVMNLFIPKCTDSTLGYYYRETPHLSDYDGAAVKSALLKAAEKKDEIFCFYIEDSLDYQEAVTLLFAEYPQYFFEYVSSVNNYLEDYSVDNSNISYYPLEQCRAIAVMLKYY